MFRFFTLLTILLILSVSASTAQYRLSGEPFSTRSEVIAKNGMTATNHPLASQIAVEILKKGGSAVDAAIAANVFLGLSDPSMNGLGGTCLMECSTMGDLTIEKMVRQQVISILRVF